MKVGSIGSGPGAGGGAGGPGGLGGTGGVGTRQRTTYEAPAPKRTTSPPAFVVAISPVGRGRTPSSSPQVVNTALEVTLFDFNGRQIPRVTIDNRPQFTCTIERSPAINGLNVDAVVRFFANGNLAVTIRLLGVEQVLCPSPNVGTVNVANIGELDDDFVEVPLTDFGGVLGAILSGTA